MWIWIRLNLLAFSSLDLDQSKKKNIVGAVTVLLLRQNLYGVGSDLENDSAL